MTRQLHSPGGFEATAEVLTWDVCVFRVSAEARSFVVCIPGAEYESWSADFAGGTLDGELMSVAADPPRRVLRAMPQTVRRAQRHQPMRVGIEHEYRVIARDRDAVDFRALLPALLPEHRRADPADLNAVRMDWGVVTADGAEAEVATPPLEVCPGFAERTVEATVAAREGLAALLPADHRLIGFSTHISVSWDVRRDRRAASRWAEVFAPALMLLLDGPESPGLLVRPRPGRLELCGDYCTGESLAASVALAVATVRHASVNGSRRSRELAVRARIERAVQRYGYYIDRGAFGCDLYDGGRAAQLTRRRGGIITAGAHLQRIIDAVVGDLAAVGGDADVAALRYVPSGEVVLAHDREGD